MDRLKERMEMAKKALISFREVLQYHEVNDIIKDAAIHRFKSTFEANWKFAKQYLYDIEGLDIGSPKGVIRSCREVSLLSDQETVLALKMVDNRNLTVHTYNVELSYEIFRQLPKYLELMDKWFIQMEVSVK